MSKFTLREKVPAVAVAQAGLTTLLQLKTGSHDRLTCQFKVATHDLDAFVISGKVGPDADYVTLYSTTESFSNPTALLVSCNGDLTAQAAASTGLFILDVGGFYQVKLEASSAHAAGSSVDVYAGLR